MGKKQILIGLAIVTFITIAVGLFFKFKPTKTEAKTTNQENLQKSIKAVGTLEAKEIILVAPKTTSMIEHIYVDEGDFVKKGQTLVVLQANEAQANMAESEAAIGKADFQISAQKANIEDLEHKMQIADTNLKRYKSLLAQGFVSQAEFENIAIAQKSASSGLAMAEENLKMYEKELQKAKANLNVQKSKFGDSILKSQIDGVVVSRNLESGSTVNAGTVILKIANPDSQWVKVYVDERQMDKVKLGMKAKVTLRTSADKIFDANVVRIGVESDRVTEERIIYLKLEKNPDTFHLADQAEAELIL